MAEIPRRSEGDLRYTGSREGEAREYQRKIDSESSRAAAWLASLSVIGVGLHLFGRKVGVNIIAELIDVAGFTAKKAGGFFTKKLPSTTRPEVAERLTSALEASMTTKEVLLRTRGGAALEEVGLVQQIIESLGVIYDPKHVTNIEGLEQGFKDYFQSFPRSLGDPSKAGNKIAHDLDLLTFGDLLDHNQNFFKSVLTNRQAPTGQPLALAAIKEALRRKWITPNTIVDPKLFKAGAKGATESLSARQASKLSAVRGSLKGEGLMGGRLLDLRGLNARHALDTIGRGFNPMGLVSSTASLFKSPKQVAVLGAEKSGGRERIFIGGNLFEIPRKGPLKQIATNQRLGDVGDPLHRSSVLRGLAQKGKLSEAYRGPGPKASAYVKLQHKLGLGQEFQENTGGFVRSLYQIVAGSRAVGKGKAKFVAKAYKSSNTAQALAGDRVPFERVAQSNLQKSAFYERAGETIKPEELGLFGRLKAYTGMHSDIALVKTSSVKRQTLGNEDLYFPDKGAGLKNLTSIITNQGEKRSVNALGNLAEVQRAQHYSSSANVIDKTYDFANYMAIRLNSLASSSMLGIGFRPSGSLAANVGRLASIPAIYMAGYEALKYADYELGQITGFRPSEVAADAYTSTRVAQQQLREASGIRAGADYFEQVLPGLDLGSIGTISAAGVAVRALEKTGSIGKALKLAGALYAAIGGPEVSQTSEDLAAEYSGEQQVAIRKARFWGLGFQPFKGGEISHFEPSWYQKLKKKPVETNIYGSEENYWAHGSFLPNVRNWMGLRNIVDPYWVERENYESRPYPVTSSFGEEIPLIGPIFADTIGSIIKPKIRMHNEDAQATLTANLSNRGAPANIASYLGIPEAPLVRGEMGRGDAVSTRLQKYANVALEPTGIWKFALGFFGVKFRDDFEEATSLDMDSISRRFYGSNMGGAFGQTEFIRRFIMSDYGTPSKINQQINPIANMMPRWLPGRHSNYKGDRNSYYDYTIGDPFTKIEGGEYRLPGKGYEAMHALHGQETRRKEQEITLEAKVVKVIDGDTVDVRIGSGTQRIRLAETFSPEKNSSAGQAAKNALHSILKPGETISVKTSKDVFGSGQDTGPYGRTIATIYKGGANVNRAMINSGHAKHVDSKYDAVDRFLILSDVAPNSQAYIAAEAEVKSMALSPEWQSKIENAKENAAKKADRYGFKEYQEQDIRASQELNAVGQTIRSSYLTLHENVLSEIPLIGSKVFPKRDPVGHYRKFQVEGDNFADWNNPYESIVRPAIYDVAGDNPIMGAVKGGVLGVLVSSQMGKFLNPIQALADPINRKGMVTTAAMFGAGASTARAISAGRLEGGYVPGHLEEERELKEYFDNIKYVKYRNLFEMGTEVGSDEITNYARQDARRTTLYGLYDLKKNGNIDAYKGILSRDERNYFDAFLNNPERKSELFSILPGHMKEALQTVWGGGGESVLTPDQQAEEYFDSHSLPGSSWLGWHPDTSDAAIQIKMIEGGINGISDNIHRFGFYPRQSLEANITHAHVSSPTDDIYNTSQNMELPWKIRQRGGSILNEFNFGSGPNINTTNLTLHDNRTNDTFYFMNYIR